MRVTLKALRANKGMTQEEAAKAIGVSQYTWQNYERGKTFPDVPTIKKIEKSFNVAYNDIIFLTK
ncbi:helix-turn-helix transcriptional regulator [Limosilactobacillus mucosae]|uniref:helix-turn-helix transcriptional regulator n=1 Tax=Limosilactobacillus mucosae TaxID=97478 RepID=UPI0022E36C86|nr:helix-turn-helix transcriptional regulator [Limosilactobacillus mucosae]